MEIKSSWEDAFDLKFKIVVLGDEAVGKTSIQKRFISKDFNSEETSTFGVDFSKKNIVVDGVRVQLLIFDTAGQKRFQTVTRSYYRGADGFVIVYDIRYRVVDHWLEDIRKYGGSNVPVLLVANKADLLENCQPHTEQAQDFFNQYEEVISVVETSAKHNSNISEAFTVLVKLLKKQKEQRDELLQQSEHANSGGLQSLVTRLTNVLKKDQESIENTGKSRRTDLKLDDQVSALGGQVQRHEMGIAEVRNELQELVPTIDKLIQDVAIIKSNMLKLVNEIKDVKNENLMMEQVIQAVNIKCNEDTQKLKQQIKSLEKRKSKDLTNKHTVV